jgi:uncharacterized protein (DUF2147 family)
MSQLRTGKVFVTSASSIVFGDLDTSWSSVAAGHWLYVNGSSVTYNVASRTQRVVGDFAAYAGGTTYAINARVASAGKIYASNYNSNTGHDPASSPTYWTECSGWEITLTSAWADASAAKVVYGIVTDFSSVYNFPLPAHGDVGVPAVLARAIVRIEEELAALVVGPGGTTYTFTASDFNVSGSNVSLDYTNGQKASGSVPGFLSSTDWTTFNNKVSTSAIGSTVQAYSANLVTFAGITPSANVQSLLAAANYAAFKTLLSLGNLDNTSDLSKPISTATQAALDAKMAIGANLSASQLTSGTVAPDRLAAGTALQVFRRNAANNAIECVTISAGGGDMLNVDNLAYLTNAATARTNLGLGNVNNTSDANKPVSTAQATADGVVATNASNALAAHTGNTSNPHSVTATQVGLGNCNNTSDLNKPISTATQSALDAKMTIGAAIGASQVTSGTLSADRLASGTGLQLLRRNAGNTALEFVTLGSLGGGDLVSTNNLSDLTNFGQARINLSLNNLTNVAQIPLSYLDTDVALTANSDTKVSSQKAVKSYVTAATGHIPVIADTTGVSQAAAGFNAAIDAAAAAGGGIVFVPAGTYLVSGVSGQRIILKSKVVLEFAPGVTITSGAHGSTSRIIEIDTNNASTLEEVGIHGNGLRIVGNRSQAFTQYGVYVNVQAFGHVLKRLVIKDVIISDCRTDGYIITGTVGTAAAEDVSITNVISDNCYRTGGTLVHAKRVTLVNCKGRNTNGTSPQVGFNIEPDTSLTVEDVSVLGGQFDSNASHGFFVQTGLGTTTRIRVSQVAAQSNGGYGLYANNASDVIFTSCTGRSNTSHGMAMASCQYSSMIGGRAISNTGDGVYFTGNYGGALSAVVSSLNGGSGFNITDIASVSGTTVASGCIAYGNTSRGFNLTNCSHVTLSGGSSIFNGQEGVRLNQAAACLVTGMITAENSQVAGDNIADNIAVVGNSNNNNITGNSTRQARRYFTGTATAGGVGTVTLPATRNTSTDNYYAGMTLRTISGTGSGQTKTITSYVASTGVVTISGSWGTTPDATTVVAISSAIRPKYGISIAAGCNDNSNTGNDLVGGGATGESNDLGTGTRYNILKVAFPALSNSAGNPGEIASSVTGSEFAIYGPNSGNGWLFGTLFSK